MSDSLYFTPNTCEAVPLGHTAGCVFKTVKEASEKEERKATFNMDKVRKNLPLLTKVVKGRPDLEMFILFALQVVIHKNDIYTGQFVSYFEPPSDAVQGRYS